MLAGGMRSHFICEFKLMKRRKASEGFRTTRASVTVELVVAADCAFGFPL